MIARLSKRMASFFVRNEIIKSEDADVYEYGLQILLSTVFNGLIALILAMIGLAADLVWLATGLVMRSSLSCKINNYICVDTTIGVSLATSNATSGGTYISSSGKNYLVDYSISKYYIAQQMFRFDIFAKRWAEAKYLGYLKNDRFGFDDDYFIKHDADSDIKATDNINKLDQIYINY